MDLNILSLSDIHMGAHRLNDEHMYNIFSTYIYPQLNDDLDMLLIAGDFFHTIINLNSKTGYYVTRIISELKSLSYRHKFYIRIIRGTFSHDRHQLHLFDIKRDHCEENDDRIKVYNSLAYEYIKKLDIHMLYMPDDLLYEDTVQATKDLLKQHHITSVDIILRHGYFDHLLPANILKKPENSINYNEIKDLVKGFIVNGHIHTGSVYKNVFSGGSLDRWVHGEEHTKGIFKLKYNTKNNKYTYEFIENKDAYVYRTVNVVNMQTEEAYKYLVTTISTIYLNTLTYPVNIRIVTKDINLKQLITTSSLKDEYPNVIFIFKKPKEVEVIETIKEEVIDLPKITKNNLSFLIHTFLNKQYKIDMDKDNISTILKSISV